jgi:hypothetical protein
MNLLRRNGLAIATVLAAIGCFSSLAWGQTSPAASGTEIPAADANAAARRQIVESDRWKQMRSAFDQWLSVQQIYTMDEVASMRAELNDRARAMSPQELEGLLSEMEQRLAVLTSPEAEQARMWVSQFLAVQAKHSDEELRQMRPDVMNMTAGQIRNELQQFQQRRLATQQSQAAFDRGRALQVQSAQGMQDARRSANQPAQNSGSRAASHTEFRVPNAPRRDPPLLINQPPIYTVGPWGSPIRFDPLRTRW